MARCSGWQEMARCSGWQDVPDGKMFRMARKDKMFRMASPERAIYRAGSLTLSLDSVSACHVSNPERVIQHKALWPEVPLDAIEASLQPTALKNAPPNMRIVNKRTAFMRVIFVEGCDPPRK